MSQQTSEKRIIDNSVQQLRLLTGAGVPKYVEDTISPVFQVNDGFVDDVLISSAERTTTGTTAILTTNVAGTTWISHIILSITGNAAL